MFINGNKVWLVSEQLHDLAMGYLSKVCSQWALNTHFEPCARLACTGQGVVTYASPVEAFVTTIQDFWSSKRVLDCSIVHFWGTWSLGFQQLKVKLKLDLLILSSLEVTLTPWSPPQNGLITWFKFDSGHKRFYMGHISDYPLQGGQQLGDWLDTYSLVLIIALVPW